ncbi:MAG: lipoyl(octanoyl) transferase LipB [Gammaproteobacteria bacterium]|nr:lipoyl(octanoyl) transferase LipB [Gammaproteobacteria bacterium]
MNLSADSGKSFIVRHLGLRDYPDVWHDMQRFTDTRTPDTRDEIWVLEHPPVFTLGLNGKPEHILDPGDIPVVKCDRGGQVTYHGPGQLIIYLLLNLRRRELGVKTLVREIEQAIIDLLQDNGIHGQRREGAPGIYVDDAKIAALGLRVRRGCCYHGLSFNVDMDLEPFSRINPCGFAGLKITQLHDLQPCTDFEHINDALLQQLEQQLLAK